MFASFYIMQAIFSESGISLLGLHVEQGTRESTCNTMLQFCACYSTKVQQYQLNTILIQLLFSFQKMKTKRPTLLP